MVTHQSSRRVPARVAAMVNMLVLTVGCLTRTAGRSTPLDDSAYLVFQNDTEDEVRVFVVAGEKRWLVGHVQAFRMARLHVPTDLATNPIQVVAVAAVPVGGRGLTGEPAPGSMVLSDSELADGITRFDWTLSGHTLSAAPRSHRRH